MRLSSFRTVRIASGLAVPLVTLLLACGEAPTDPTGLTEGLPVAAGHVSGGEGHGKVTVTIIQQPVIDANPSPDIDSCRIHYGFEMSAKGKETPVRWSAYWSGGEHDGVRIGSNLNTLGGELEPVLVTPIAGHPDDGHSFDALRFVVSDPNDLQEVLAEAYSEGATISCS
jgi:hypothetical protein